MYRKSRRFPGEASKVCDLLITLSMTLGELGEEEKPCVLDRRQREKEERRLKRFIEGEGYDSNERGKSTHLAELTRPLVVLESHHGAF